MAAAMEPGKRRLQHGLGDAPGDFVKKQTLRAARLIMKTPVRKQIRPKISLLGHRWRHRQCPQLFDRISFRATEEEKQRIEAAAQRAHKSRSDFIRTVVVRVAKREMLKPVLPVGRDGFTDPDTLILAASRHAKRGGPGYRELGQYVARNLAGLRPELYRYDAIDDQWMARVSELLELIRRAAPDITVLRWFTEEYRPIRRVPKRRLVQFLNGGYSVVKA